MLYKEQEIVDWGMARGIIQDGNRLAQGLKTVSEIAELIDNVQKNKPVLDDIGDIYVTIVMQAAMNNCSVEYCIDENIDFDANPNKDIQLAEMVLDCAMMLEYTYPDTVNGSELVQIYIANIFHGLQHMCAVFGIKMKDCVDVAYDDIKDRTGQMVNGVFKKDV